MLGSDRRIEVDIVAHDDASRVFNRVSSQSSSMAHRFNNSMTSMSQNLHRYNAAMSTFNRYTQLAMIGAGYAIYRFTKDSIKSFAEFERQHAKTMGTIASNYDKTTEAQRRFINESQKLKQQSLQLGTFGPDGKGSLYNPQQIAFAQTTLVKAGKTAPQILDSGVLSKVIQFAGGNDMGMEAAAEMAVNVGTMFNIPMEKWGDMMDKMTRAADVSTVDVPEIFESLKYAGGISSAMKRPLEDVLAVIALMGNVGLKGSMAGTGLQAFLTRILNPIGVTEKALAKAPSEYSAQALQSFVASATDQSGKFKPLAEVTGMLDEVMESFTDKEQAWFAHKLFGLFQMKAGFALANGGGDSLQGIINDLNINAPGSNERKWDVMLGSSYGKQTALSNVWFGMKTDIGERISPLTNAIADELFRALANKGNYKIDFNKIQKAIDKSSDAISIQYGKELGDIVKRISNGGINLTRSGAASAPLMEGIIGGFSKLLGGDLSGSLESFGNGLKKSNDNIDKLPPELQSMAKEVRNAVIALTTLTTVNFAARVLDSFATIWRYSIGKMFTANMNVVATTVLLNTGLLNKNGAPILKQGTQVGGTAGGGNSNSGGARGPIIVGPGGAPIGGGGTQAVPPGSTILGANGNPLPAPATGTPKGAWKGKVGKGIGIASWTYAIGEMTGANSWALDKMGVQGNTRKNVDSGRNILNWGLTAKFIDSLLLKNAGSNAIKGAIASSVPGMWSMLGTAAAASGTAGAAATGALGGVALAPIALVAADLYRQQQRKSHDDDLIAQGKQPGKSWYWNDRALASESGPLGKLKALFTGYSDGIIVRDSKEEWDRKQAEYRNNNRYKYMEGSDDYITATKPSRPWYDYLNPMSNYSNELNAWQSHIDSVESDRSRERNYFDAAQKLSAGSGSQLSWAEYSSQMAEWKKKVDDNRATSRGSVDQLQSQIGGSLLSPFSNLIDTIKTMPAPTVNVPTVNVHVTVDQNGNILNKQSFIGDMNDLNNPLKIFNSRFGK